jgi:hypothetical protein
MDGGVRLRAYESSLNMSDPNIDIICKWPASMSLLLRFNAHNTRHSLCDPFFKFRNVHFAFFVKKSRIERSERLLALRKKIRLLLNLHGPTNHLMNKGLSTIGEPDIAHPKLIGRSIFRRLDPDLQARVHWSDCS